MRTTFCGLAATALWLAPPALAACDGLVPSRGAHAAGQRDVTARDLVELRDIGDPQASPLDPVSPLAVSPDGRQVAFVLQRAEPRTNQMCRALVVAAIDKDPELRVVDRGGAPVTISAAVRGLMVDSGTIATITPAWSPDGRRLAWRRRIGAGVELRIAASDGGGAHTVSRPREEVESFAWSKGGAALVYRIVDAEARRAALAREGLGGYLYDDRFVPAYGSAPRLKGPLARRVRSTGLVTGRTGEPTADDLEALAGDPAPAPDARLWARGEVGAAWTAPVDRSPAARAQIWIRRGRTATRCEGTGCRGRIAGLWWFGRDLLILKREGWALGESALYRLPDGARSPKSILRTGDALQGCVPAGTRLLCMHEGPMQPRRIVAIDPSGGSMMPLFDPNPEFVGLRMGSVRRLYWRNHRGLEARGDLVLPPGAASGSKLPLVIVQYHSDGFLRGGTGDEYPIHAFAARGIAVLSLERPISVGASLPGLTSQAQVAAANAQDWAERHSLLSSLVAGVARAMAEAPIDEKRIGITGMSDGATTVQFALANGHRFAAAAISSCCMDRNTVNIYGGAAWANYLRGLGYPPASTPAPAFWGAASLAANAARVDTPILMQLADEEYLLALESFTALRDAGRAVEMYVFPDEHHTKGQPAHRLAIYARNLDWFDFWLRGVEDPDPAKQEQYARWRLLRQRVIPAGPGASMPAPRAPHRADASPGRSPCRC